MTDRLARTLTPSGHLLLCVDATETAREAARRHELAPSSAAFLGQGLTAGLLLAALQKDGETRVGLQLQCDGPAARMVVDADGQGFARGYVGGMHVRFPGASRFDSRAMLGGVGQLGVVRERRGQFYRGTVALEPGDLASNVERYFTRSEQVPTVICLEAHPDGEQPLGFVGGLLLQLVPQGDKDRFESLARTLKAGVFSEWLQEGTHDPHELIERLVPEHQATAEAEAGFRCSCSKERVMGALRAISEAEIVEMIAVDGGASSDCDFCRTRYDISEADLRQLLATMDAERTAEA